MSQAVITVRMDEELKNDFADLMDEFGLSVSAAFTMFAKTAVREQRIPFELSLNRFSAETREALREAVRLAESPDTEWYGSTRELREAKGWQ